MAEALRAAPTYVTLMSVTRAFLGCALPGLPWTATIANRDACGGMYVLPDSLRSPMMRRPRTNTGRQCRASGALHLKNICFSACDATPKSVVAWYASVDRGALRNGCALMGVLLRRTARRMGRAQTRMDAHIKVAERQ